MQDHDSTTFRAPRRYKNATPTTYEIDPETGAALIPLGGKKYPGRFALVDAQDAPLVAPFSWHPTSVASRGDRLILYATSRVPDLGHVYMHRFILGLRDPKVKVDHENHNGLDNRRENLRTGTHQQNIFNRRPNLNASSKYKGVHWANRRSRWVARIKHNDRMIELGCFHDEREAAEVYDGAALMLFGSRAYLNFPDEEQEAS